MTSDTLRPPEQRFNYSNALTGLVSLVRNEGLGGLFKGVGTNTVRRYSVWPTLDRPPHLLYPVSCHSHERMWFSLLLRVS